jgi:hypothetical protein
MTDTNFTRPVNWFEEELDITYGNDNEGYVHGIYLYDGEDVIDVQWYKSEEERNKDLID